MLFAWLCLGVVVLCTWFSDAVRRPEATCFVAACNRTYYGDLGKTYELELHRPREDRMPFVCHLTLTAGAGSLGDIVQVTRVYLPAGLSL